MTLSIFFLAQEELSRAAGVGLGEGLQDQDLLPAVPYQRVARHAGPAGMQSQSEDVSKPVFQPSYNFQPLSSVVDENAEQFLSSAKDKQ